MCKQLVLSCFCKTISMQKLIFSNSIFVLYTKNLVFTSLLYFYYILTVKPFNHLLLPNVNESNVLQGLEW